MVQRKQNQAITEDDEDYDCYWSFVVYLINEILFAEMEVLPIVMYFVEMEALL